MLGCKLARGRRTPYTIASVRFEIGFQAGNLVADTRLLAHVYQDLDQPPGHGRLDFNDRFFRFNLDQRLADGHRIAHVLEPAGDPDRLHHKPDFRNLLSNQRHFGYSCACASRPRSWRAARTMSLLPGSRARSSAGAKGMGAKGQPTRTTGASSSSKSSVPIRAAISAPMPPFRTASCAISTR